MEQMNGVAEQDTKMPKRPLKQERYRLDSRADGDGVRMRTITFGLYEDYQRLAVRSLSISEEDRTAICGNMGWVLEDVTPDLGRMQHLQQLAQLLTGVEVEDYRTLNLEEVQRLNKDFLLRSSGLSDML